MIKKIFSAFIFSLFILFSLAQESKLPLKEWNSVANKPLVFYISGDGGYTSFSEGVCSTINKTGYQVLSLNSKSYFDDKKTPQQTTDDIVNYLNDKFNKRKDQQFILIGYSFGADITPFVVNLFPDSIKKKLVSVVLLSPSTSTDFETHVWDKLGLKKKRNMDVVAEVNKLGAIKTTIILGNDDDEFPIKSIKLKNYVHELLPGGHHYEGNTDEVATTMMKYF
ncbi:MAG: virulence factor family protein [Bacteroidetes bacterium]|nr:MAG: virulence factor family protein [Bacteroidota bacterium]